MSSPANTNQHYDLDPGIFGAFLDPLRKYSSAYYIDPLTSGDGDSLETAQRRKLQFVADRVRVGRGSRILDVGCGWGSLLLYMAQELGADVTGISPAPRQHEYIANESSQRGVADRVKTYVGAFEETTPPSSGFDAVTMLGSIVHMPSLDASFDKARSLMRTGGRLYVSESCFRNERFRKDFGERDGSIFVRDAIFGWGDMRPLSSLVQAAENSGLTIVAVDDLTAHYKRTISDWIRNVELNAEAIDELRPSTSSELVHYLQIANAGWGYTTKHYALTCVKSR